MTPHTRLALSEVCLWASGFFIGLSIGLFAGCAPTPYQKAPKARVYLVMTPAQAFIGTPLEVRVHIAAHPSNRAAMVQVDGGPDFFSISSFELIPDVPTTRVLHYPRPRGLDPDGLIVTTVTVIGPLGPIATADQIAYRRKE